MKIADAASQRRPEMNGNEQRAQFRQLTRYDFRKFRSIPRKMRTHGLSGDAEQRLLPQVTELGHGDATFFCPK